MIAHKFMSGQVRVVLRIMEKNRVVNGETYVAGGLALNHLLHRPLATDRRIARYGSRKSTPFSSK